MADAKCKKEDLYFCLKHVIEGYSKNATYGDFEQDLRAIVLELAKEGCVQFGFIKLAELTTDH